MRGRTKVDFCGTRAIGAAASGGLPRKPRQTAVVIGRMPLRSVSGSLGTDASADHSSSWGLRAFGLAIAANLPLIGGFPDWAPLGDRSVVLTQDRSRDLSPAREPDRGEILLERRYADGALGMRVTLDSPDCYRVAAPGHGNFTVSRGGSRIGCHLLATDAWRWHRPLYAQVLPLAATLQGLELLHASAVVMHGRAVAFVARSGTGKTSLAVHLTALGARLLTDDVLALEFSDGTVVAHAGAPMANVAEEQLELLSPVCRARLGEQVGKSDKAHLELVNLPSEPIPLGAVFLLERLHTTERIVFDTGDRPDARRLLAGAFIAHITSPARLINQLNVCAEVAARVPIFEMRAPARLSATALAAAVERQLAERL